MTASRLTWVTKQVQLIPFGQLVDQAACPASHPRVIAGACGGTPGIDVKESAPIENNGLWECAIVNLSGSNSVTVKLSVLCGPPQIAQ